jgi:hypothetical protein
VADKDNAKHADDNKKDETEEIGKNTIEDMAERRILRKKGRG